MKKLYPGYAGEGFQLHMTGKNPAWNDLAKTR